MLLGLFVAGETLHIFEPTLCNLSRLVAPVARGLDLATLADGPFAAAVVRLWLGADAAACVGG